MITKFTIFSLFFLILQVKSSIWSSQGLSLSHPVQLNRLASLSQSSSYTYDLGWATWSASITSKVISPGKISTTTFYPSFAIFLYSNISVLNYGCNFLTYFQCAGNVYCNQYASQTLTARYTNLNVSGYQITTNLNLESGEYQSNNMSFLYAQSCQPDNYNAGSYLYGIIGMGYSGISVQNYDSVPEFSIYMDLEGSNELLLWELDSEWIDNSTNPTQFNSSANWEIFFNSASNDSVELGNLSIPFTGKSIFDINSLYIEMPMPIYTAVVNELANYSVNCNLQDGSFGISCTFSGNISALPTINIGGSTNNSLAILPEIYLNPQGDNITYTLMIAGTSNSSSPATFVNSFYSDTIILGVPFMGYYYTYFYNETITIYKAKIYGAIGQWWWFMMALVGSLFVTIGLYYLCSLRKICLVRPNTKVLFDDNEKPRNSLLEIHQPLAPTQEENTPTPQFTDADYQRMYN